MFFVNIKYNTFAKVHPQVCDSFYHKRKAMPELEKVSSKEKKACQQSTWKYDNENDPKYGKGTCSYYFFTFIKRLRKLSKSKLVPGRDTSVGLSCHLLIILDTFDMKSKKIQIQVLQSKFCYLLGQ